MLSSCGNKIINIMHYAELAYSTLQLADAQEQTKAPQQHRRYCVYIQPNCNMSPNEERKQIIRKCKCERKGKETFSIRESQPI